MHDSSNGLNSTYGLGDTTRSIALDDSRDLRSLNASRNASSLNASSLNASTSRDASLLAASHQSSGSGRLAMEDLSSSPGNLTGVTIDSEKPIRSGRPAQRHVSEEAPAPSPSNSPSDSSMQSDGRNS